jgi:hypothetical protein
MASTYVNDLRLNEMATGDASGSWGTVTNTNLELIGEAFSYGTETIGDADSTLTIADGAADAARSFYLKITSSVDLTTTRIVTLGPNTVSKVWMIENATTGSQVITIKQGSGATINVPNGQVKMISTDGAGSGGAVLDLLVDVDLTGTTTLVNLDVSGAVDIAGDLTLSAGGDGALRFTAASSVKVLDNNAAALVFEEADNAYMTFVTTDGSEAVKFDKALDINAATQIDATVTVGVDDTGYDVKFFGATTGKSLLWDESADSLIVTGSTSLQGGLEVGVDDTGYDVKFFGATAGAYMLWDESADDLILGGAAGLSVNSTALVTGVLTTTAATVSNGGGQFNGAMNVGVDDTGYDVKFFGATAGKYMLWDESADTLEVSGTVTADGLTVDGYGTFSRPDNENLFIADTTHTTRSSFQVSSATTFFNGNIDSASHGLFIWRSSNAYTERMRIDSSGGLITKPAAGGHAVFNEDGADADFRVESDTDANALFVEGSSGNVGIGTSSPITKLDVYGAQVLNRGVIQALDSTAQAAGTGAGLVLGGFYSPSQTTSGVQIKASKTNGTSSDYGFDMSFLTLQNGTSNLTERMRIDSNGFTKHSNTGVYNTYSGADDSHQFISDNTGHATLWVNNTNASYDSAMLRTESVRAASTAFIFLACTSGNLTDDEFILRGDGNAFADGTWSGGGADYAEYFEWNDGNTNNEDRVGYSVSLVNNKIKIAESGETVIGVISGNPSVVGDDSWNSWKNKYLKDDFGRYVWENYTLTTWTTEDLIEKSYHSDRIPADEVVPEDAVITTQDSAGNAYKRKQLNPDYDDSLEYQDRESRAEWDIVGLMGKLRIRAGQEVGASWIKMQDISATVEEWLIK